MQVGFDFANGNGARQWLHEAPAVLRVVDADRLEDGEPIVLSERLLEHLEGPRRVERIILIAEEDLLFDREPLALDPCHPTLVDARLADERLAILIANDVRDEM